MKRKTVLAILVLLSFSAIHAQDSIYQVINKETCACITAKSSRPFQLEDYRACITQTLNRNMQTILVELKKQNPDSLHYYQMGYKYGQAIGSRLDTDLVYNCDAYFKIADTMRASAFRISNMDSLRQRLVLLNGPANVRDLSFFRQRAIVNFLLGLINDANSDAEQVLKQEPTNIACLLIHATYLEGNKQYNEAAALFYTLDKLTGEHAYLVSAAINNRKEKELH